MKTNLKRKANIIILLALLVGVASCAPKLTTSSLIKEWTIDEYSITYSSKIGPAGSDFYQYDVYKKGRHLSYAVSPIGSDSCMIRFREKNDFYVDFNLCKHTKKVLTPDKVEFSLNSIDSITIRPYDSLRLIPSGKSYPDPFYDTVVTKNFDPAQSKQLTTKEIQIFIKKWNRSKTNGFDHLGKTYDYLITVYSKGSVRKIKTLGNYLTENEHWSYETREDHFFDELWNNTTTR